MFIKFKIKVKNKSSLNIFVNMSQTLLSISRKIDSWIESDLQEVFLSGVFKTIFMNSFLQNLRISFGSSIKGLGGLPAIITKEFNKCSSTSIFKPSMSLALAIGNGPCYIES